MEQRRSAIGLVLVAAGIAALTLVLSRIGSGALAIVGVLLLAVGARLLRPSPARHVAAPDITATGSPAVAATFGTRNPPATSATTPKRTMAPAMPATKRTLALTVAATKRSLPPSLPRRSRLFGAPGNDSAAERIARLPPVQRHLAEAPFGLSVRRAAAERAKARG